MNATLCETDSTQKATCASATLAIRHAMNRIRFSSFTQVVSSINETAVLCVYQYSS